MRTLLRSHLRFFLLAALSGLALRLLFLFAFPAITADSFIYGDIAKNWLRHGVYGVTDGGMVTPTYIRLPGYPAFLAVVFSIFGMEHYRAVLVIQILIDLASCFLIADMARRLFSDRAAKVASLIAALCPFFANYAAAALTETLEIFCTTLALNFAIRELTGETPDVSSAGWDHFGSGRLSAADCRRNVLNLFTCAPVSLHDPTQPRSSFGGKNSSVLALKRVLPS